jgi:hypothetical protein
MIDDNALLVDGLMLDVRHYVASRLMVVDG